MSRRVSGYMRVRGVVFAAVLGTTMCMTTYGASAATKTASSPTKAQIARVCLRVTDALADGPDADVDPIGNALAQILPLRAIKTSDKALQSAINGLASAYQTVYKTHDKKGTEAAVDKAGKKIDVICPGAF